MFHEDIIISKIEKIRKNNNVNWMNILRIAFKFSPRATARIMSKIYTDDQKISSLVKNFYKMKVQIRKALIKDSEFLFNLRNEKIVRKNSFNKK